VTTIGEAGDPPVAGTFERIEHETGFTAILLRLLRATPGAVGAALVDAEGEAVDYAGDRIEPFELKVAAAHWRIVLAEIELGALAKRGGATRRLLVETTRRVFVIDALPDGYALLSVLASDAATGGDPDRVLDVALRDLYVEAGWACPPDLFRWHEVDVRMGDGARPVSVRSGQVWEAVRVIGRVATGLQQDEVGFRVGVGSEDCELTLVRGRDARWYADMPPESIKQQELSR
jgi:hypothetical protein